MAYAKPKYDQAGGGCLVQLIGVVLLFFFPLGTFLGACLLVGGSIMSRKWRCSSCGNPVIDNQVQICPTCKTEFNEKARWYQL